MVTYVVYAVHLLRAVLASQLDQPSPIGGACLMNHGPRPVASLATWTVRVGPWPPSLSVFRAVARYHQTVERRRTPVAAIAAPSGLMAMQIKPVIQATR
jgi:hypothetical protein